MVKTLWGALNERDNSVGHKKGIVKKKKNSSVNIHDACLKFSTTCLMITPHCIPILDLISVHQKLGKGPLHAHKLTQMPCREIRTQTLLCILYIGVSFRALPAYPEVIGGTTSAISAPPTTNSPPIYSS